MSSYANRRVIFSISSGSHFVGSICSPPFDPPKGASTRAHLYVIRAANASTSSWFTEVANLIPPFTGSLCSECTDR